MPRIDSQKPYTNHLKIGKRIVVAPVSGTARLTVIGPNGGRTTANTTTTMVMGPFALEMDYRVDVFSGLADVSEEYVEQVSLGSSPAPLDTDLVLTAADDRRSYACTAALTVTIPANLSPRPSVVLIPPPTGNLTVAVTGGAQVNAATASLTRSRIVNPAGVALVPYAEADAYGLSGS